MNSHPANSVSNFPTASTRTSGGWRHHEGSRPSPSESTHGNSRLVNPRPLPGKNQCPAQGSSKEYRKKLQPLSETSRLIQSELPSDAGSLLSALGKFIHGRFGVNIPAAAWPVDKLPEHLQMRYSIVDAKGQEVTSGRDLRLFQDTFWPLRNLSLQ